MAQAATKIQAHFRGQRDRAIVEVQKAQAEFRAKSKAERDLLFAMVRQSSLDGLTDVQAMTKVPQHVQRAPRRLGRLNSCFTPASLGLRPPKPPLTRACTFPKQAIRNATTGGWAIDPNASEWTAYWDLMMMALLTVVLFLTPYEVAFLAPSVGVLFVINRVLDLIFFCDMVIQFFLAYQSGPEQGSTWVKSLPMIRKRYMKGWFAVDLLSVLPFWIFGTLINSEEDDGAGADQSGGGGAESLLRVVRSVRLLRLIKLGKVLGMSRILKRYEAHMDVTYARISLIKILCIIVAWSHLQACFWGIIPTLEAEGKDTWLTDLAESQGTTLEDLDAGAQVRRPHSTGPS